MNRKRLAIWTAILISAALGTSVLLAQKAAIPEAPPPPPKVKAHPPEHMRQMIMFNGDEGSWLGVTVADVTAEKAKELKLSGEYGAIVQEVREDSPAAKAGLEKGDVILQFAGEKVRSVAELHRLVRETPAGRKVSLEISRGGHAQTLSAEIGNPPEQRWVSHFDMPEVRIPEVHVPDFNFNMMFGGGPRLGISGDDLTKQLAGYFGVWQGKGVLVREVQDGSPAQKAGLKAGDVIIKVGDEVIGSVPDLREALRKSSDAKRQVSVTIVRDRKEQTLSVQLEEPPQELIGPKRIAELHELQVPPEELSRVKAELAAHAAEMQINAEELRAQSEKIKEEVRRAMKDHQKEMEQLKLNLDLLRQESVAEPI